MANTTRVLWANDDTKEPTTVVFGGSDEIRLTVTTADGSVDFTGSTCTADVFAPSGERLVAAGGTAASGTTTRLHSYALPSGTGTAVKVPGEGYVVAMFFVFGGYTQGYIIPVRIRAENDYSA